MTFSIVNTTNDTLAYERANSGPSVIFRILKGDSVVASSVDGYAFLMVVLGGTVVPHDTLRGYWKTPTTPAQNPKVTLYQGSYEAQVLFPRFDMVQVDSVTPIPFTVEP